MRFWSRFFLIPSIKKTSTHTSKVSKDKSTCSQIKQNNRNRVRAQTKKSLIPPATLAQSTQAQHRLHAKKNYYFVQNTDYVQQI
ncbi:unnamed protein product [Cuscuta campestris]|uniref:Uncharacterized protein n=1 Tax=Cuscuta campestris TaxID=132261 RepID=A0A484L5V1_9ASTE|nr:unnamed protein product [Cuscuta campestris]